MTASPDPLLKRAKVRGRKAAKTDLRITSIEFHNICIYVLCNENIGLTLNCCIIALTLMHIIKKILICIL